MTEEEVSRMASACAADEAVIGAMTKEEVVGIARVRFRDLILELEDDFAVAVERDEEGDELLALVMMRAVEHEPPISGALESLELMVEGAVVVVAAVVVYSTKFEGISNGADGE